MKTIILTAIILIGMVSAYSPEDYLVKDNTELSINHACTYYTLKNPSLETYNAKNDRVENELKVDYWVQEKGQLKSYSWEIFTESICQQDVWQSEMVCPEKGKNETNETCEDKGKMVKQDYDCSVWMPLDPKKLEVSSKGMKKVRICGEIIPELGPNGYSYAIDHIPSFMGYEFEGLDWWNVSWVNRSYTDISVTNITTPSMYFNVTAQGAYGDEIRFTTNASGSEAECGGWWKVQNESLNRYILNCSLSNGTTRIAYYYGNTTEVGASSKNNISLACRFGDNFDGTALSAYWTADAGVTATVSSGLLNVSGSTSYVGIWGNVNFNPYSKIWSYVNMTTTWNEGQRFAAFRGSSGNDRVEIYYPSVAAKNLYTSASASGTGGTYTYTLTNDFVKHELHWNTTRAEFRINGISLINKTTNIPAIQLPISFRQIGGSNKYSVDWVCGFDDLNDPHLVASFSAWVNETSGGGGGTIPLSVTTHSPTNTTYAYKDLVVNSTCYGGNASYYMNVTANGANILDSIVVSNNTPYNFTHDFSSAIGWQLNTTCWNGTYENTSSSVFFTMNLNPTPTLIHPTNTTYNNYNVTINYSCSGPFDSYYSNISIDNAVNITNYVVANNTNNETSLNFANGGHNITVTCLNDTWSANSSELWFTVSDTSPTVSLIAPTNETTSANSTWQFAWTCTDTGNTTLTYKLFLDGTENKTGSCTSGAECTDNIAGINIGNHYWNVECSDGTYSANATNDYNFTTDINIAFSSPTPTNGTNNFTYGIIYNCSSDRLLDNGNLIEIDGANYSATLGGNNLSFSYTLSYAEHFYNNTYDARCFGNESGTYYEGNETRTFDYYGCGFINTNGSMISNLDITNGFCFTTGVDNLIFDGDGYSIIMYGSGVPTIGILTNTSNNTFENLTVNNFDTGISVTGSNNTIRNNIVTNATSSAEKRTFYINSNDNTIENNIGYTASYGFYLGISAGNNTMNNNTIYNASQNGMYIQGTGTNISNSIVYNCTIGIDIESETNLTRNAIFSNLQYGLQIRGTNSIAYNNTIYNNTDINLYLAANDVMAWNNTLYNSTIGLDARQRDNITIYDNHYWDNSVDLSVNGTSYNATNEIFDSNGTLTGYSNISFITANTNDTLNFTRVTNPIALPADHVSFAQKFINISSENVSPTNITYSWLDSELGAIYNESRFELYKYNGSWNMLNNTPNITSNQLVLNNIDEINGMYAILENISGTGTAFFIEPTPANLSNITSNPIQIAINSSANMTNCYIEVNSVNQTGTIDATNQTCYYNITSSTHNQSYNITGWANISGTWRITNESNRTFTWYNESNCTQLLDIYNITGALPYITFSNTTMNVTGTLNINNLCPVNVTINYTLNDSTANATDTIYNITLSPSSSANFTGYPFLIPVNFTNEGTPPGFNDFLYSPVQNEWFNLTTTYNRSIANPHINVSLYGSSRLLYGCTNHVCAMNASSWSAVSYSASGVRLLSNGSTLNASLTYIESWLGDQNVGAPEEYTGVGGGASTPSPEANETPDIEVIIQSALPQGDDGNKDLVEDVKENICPIGIILAVIGALGLSYMVSKKLRLF